MPSLDDLHLFAYTVQYKGISAAATKCNLQRSKVSRRLQELEKQLGYQLLIRTTHNIELTEHGKWLYNEVASRLNALETAMGHLEEQNKEPKGKLRIAIPPVLGVTDFFTHIIELYTSLYPGVLIEIEHQKQAVDLIRTNTDIQVLPSYCPPINDDYVQQYFIDLPCSMVASHSYIEKMGRPSSIEDLDNHKLLGNRYCKQWLPNYIGYYVYSEDLHLLRNLARDGKGIVVLPTVMLQNGIKEGLFEPLLCENRFPDLKITLVYASKPYLSQKCRNMVKLLRETVVEKGVVSYPS
ncbi:LysR family transcriptional regulator [Shewanella youngdeokensis]|uniref:LysR family transcriptional regulator n=1 Tax=Shewanella youngdeokensis TaxID=2999068 RepID=A0ABZ0JUU6_9GAMM|nr:LysR family transcriptional regulator [Shewanella sp. DAU334]